MEEKKYEDDTFYFELLYYKETGKEAWKEDDYYSAYNEDYVCWLEKKLYKYKEK